MYSQVYNKRSPLVQGNNSLLQNVQFIWNALLIEVTTWPGLTVYEILPTTCPPELPNMVLMY